MDSNTEEAKQKRRQKILARAANEPTDDGEKVPDKEEQVPTQSVFQRYRNLKTREQQENKLIDISKGVGIVIVLLAMFFQTTAVFLIVVLTMLFLAFRVSGQGEKKTEKDEDFAWLGKFGSLVNQLKHLQRAIFIGRIALNTFLSYLVAAVLVNVIEVNTKSLIGQQI